MRTPSHVIILGCGRSGTSIFGELFEHLSTFSYFSEPDFAELLKMDFNRSIAVKVPKENPAHPPSPGLSFPLETLLSAIPEPKYFFWQVRHPLDTICSLRVGISKNWGHHPQPPDWQGWLPRPLLERCAHHWRYINTTGFQTVRHLVKVTYFEKMIQDPLAFAAEICHDIGVNISQESAALTSWAKRVQNTNNADFVEAKTSRSYSRPDHQTRIDRWKENLTPAEVDTITPMVSEAAAQFGYFLGHSVK